MDNSNNTIPSLLNNIWRGVLIFILVISLMVPARSVEALPPFVVNTNSDLGDAAPGDTFCATSAGNCSLRAAVEEINALGTGGTITFSNNFDIALSSTVNILSHNVIIDGAGFDITIHGPAGSATIALLIRSNYNQVRHLTMINPYGFNTLIREATESNAAYQASYNTIDDVTFIGSPYGVVIWGDYWDPNTSNQNTIQNSRFGTRLDYPTSCIESEHNANNISNYTARNTSILNNQLVCSSSDNIYSDGISGLTVSGNTIAGSASYAINFGYTSSVTISGNYIGNQGGTVPFANALDGIHLNSMGDQITIGGTALIDRNIISGNGRHGIFLNGFSTTFPITNVTIDGNLIGLSASHSPMPNQEHGIAVSFSSNVTIGSDNHAAVQQFVSGNAHDGILITASDHVNILDGTLIGIADWTGDVAPDSPAGNGWNGIRLANDVTYVNVDSWKVAYNSWAGIVAQTDGDLYNRLMPKNIYANGYIPIDLGDNGFTVNDVGDLDSGPNDLLNYPVITGLSGDTINGEVCANCMVYFYQVVADPSVNGGGARYDLGMAPETADGDGHWTAVLPAGIQPYAITMLTLDGSTGQTSEFSPAPPYIDDFIVNTDSDQQDVIPGDAKCETAVGNETCSLRAAVEEINALGSGGTISFFDDYTINLASTLYLLADDMTISGSGHAITIVGPSTGGSVAIWPAAYGGQIEYLTVTNPGGYAIYIGEYGESSWARQYVIDHVTLIGSTTGIGIYGNIDGTKGRDITVSNSLIGTSQSDPSSCNEAERNTYGVTVNGSTSDNFMSNQILCNTMVGLDTAYSSSLTIWNNTLAGNGRHGLDVYQVDTATIEKNTIGNLAGTIAFPNGEDGIRVEGYSTNITIGGSGTTDGNIISGNSQNGILIQEGSNNITIDHNLIGLTADHNNMANLVGIYIIDANNITIGADDHTVYKQFISSNTTGGIQTYNSDHIRILDNNFIGVCDPTGASEPESPSGNGMAGVYLGPGSTYVEIDAWKIAYNSGPGVAVTGDDSLHNRIQPRNINSNGPVAIDLGWDGPTLNDEGDLDLGPNDLLNYPIITVQNGNSITGLTCAYCEVFFYRRIVEPWPSGEKYDLGIPPVVANEDGEWQVTLPDGVSPRILSLMAFDSSSGQTSEFNQSFYLFLPMMIRP